MPTEPADAFSGPQDCGAFFIDAFGPYEPDRLHVTWTQAERDTTEQIDQLITDEWQRRSAEAEAAHRALWNGPLCRLIEYRSNADRLELVMGPTDYRAFVGTNLHHAYLRYTHGPELMANPVGMSAVVTTADRYVLLGCRSNQVAFHPQRIHPVAGCLEPATDSTPDPFAALTDELIEELALDVERTDRIVCLGLVRDKRIVQPELVFDVTVDAMADEIRRTQNTAQGRGEHANLLFVRDEPGSVVGFIETHAERLTPVATAALLLHGMARWGSGWFASARGYLRSLI